MEASKKCTNCQLDLPLERFGKNNAVKGGINYVCLACAAARARAYQKTEAGRSKRRARDSKKESRRRRALLRNDPPQRQKAREYAKRRRQGEEGKKLAINNARRYREKYPEKSRAQRKASRTPAKKHLCCRCGLPAQQYHHYNGYDGAAAVQVVPLCHQCHLAYEWIQKSMRSAA